MTSTSSGTSRQVSNVGFALLHEIVFIYMIGSQFAAKLILTEAA
jgi:hypothetical protein